MPILNLSVEEIALLREGLAKLADWENDPERERVITELGDRLEKVENDEKPNENAVTCSAETDVTREVALPQREV